MSTACGYMRSPGTTLWIAPSSAACTLAVIHDHVSWFSNVVCKAASAAGSEYPFIVLEEGKPEMSPDTWGS